MLEYFFIVQLIIRIILYACIYIRFYSKDAELNAKPRTFVCTSFWRLYAEAIYFDRVSYTLYIIV